jgi:hypothetical protein
MNFKAYIHDKQIVFTNLALFLIGLYTTLLVILRVDTTQTVAIIRNNTTLGLAGFEKADSSSLYQLAFISVLITVIHTFLSIRMRETKRGYAILTLGLGIVAQVFLVVVASSLLSLHR